MLSFLHCPVAWSCPFCLLKREDSVQGALGGGGFPEGHEDEPLKKNRFLQVTFLNWPLSPKWDLLPPVWEGEVAAIIRTKSQGCPSYVLLTASLSPLWFKLLEALRHTPLVAT